MDSILVVNLPNEKLLKFLEKMGYGVTVCRKGEPVVPLISDKLYDLIVIDGSVFEEGAELCRFFKAEQNTRTVPIVYLSERNEDFEALRGEGLRGVEYVQLPCSAGIIVSKIATNLRLRKMAGENEETATLGEINARLRDLNERYIKEVAEARTIQDSLMPSELPEDPRYEVAVSFQPLEDVGGDWYYVEKLPSSKVGIQVADITGHGLSAAFVSAMTKMAKIAAGTEKPGEQLTAMNRLLVTGLPEGRFVTFFSLLFEPETGKLFYARAGHPPALHLRRAEDQVEQLRGDGFPLGFLSDTIYEASEADLKVGDIVVTYTDGIIEAQNLTGEVYSYERMSAVLLNAHQMQSATDTIMMILSDFENFLQGRLLKDDITLIVLKRVK